MAGSVGTTIVVLSLLATVLSVSSLEPLVTLRTGTVRGTVVDVAGTQVNAYLGIPYAKPPVGELRFKPPVPPDSWEGVYNATERPTDCYQKLGLYNSPDRSEDCLYVNVWQPPSRPHYGTVMVWIHGGGFIEGSGTGGGGRGSGQFLAATEHVLVVSMNYRLGALGFLALGTDDAPGNMGLLDQKLALQWVQDNIARFGGNPDRVTVFGNSAGGASAHFHLLSPTSSGLFRRAILQSGAAFSNWALTPRDVAMTRGRALASALGCRQPEVRDMVACLRTSSAEDIVDNQREGFLEFGFTPVVDGNVLPSDPSELANRNRSNVDVMAGFTTNEGSIFIARETSLGFNPSTDSFINKTQYINTIRALLPTLNDFGVDAVTFEYTDWRGLENPAVYRDAVENMVGDYSFKCPVIEASLARARVGGKVYMYQFNHVLSNLPPPLWSGPFHTSEIAMVFGLPLDPSQSYTPDEDRLSRKMMGHWSNFAKTGDPNDPGSETWPAYNQTDQSYIVLDTQPVRVAQWPRARPCAFWREYLWQLQEQTDNLPCQQLTGGQKLTARLPSLTYICMGILLTMCF
ncbi:cholinesterase 1-like [Branchiostoma floridae x Branchiostoma japonicum]